MAWFHVHFIARNALHSLCNDCRLSNVTENIHEAQMLQPRIFSVTLESNKLNTKPRHNTFQRQHTQFNVLSHRQH